MSKKKVKITSKNRIFHIFVNVKGVGSLNNPNAYGTMILCSNSGKMYPISLSMKDEDSNISQIGSMTDALKKIDLGSKVVIHTESNYIYQTASKRLDDMNTSGLLNTIPIADMWGLYLDARDLHLKEGSEVVIKHTKEFQ